MNGGLHSESRTLSNMHTSDVEHRTHPLHVDLHTTQPINTDLLSNFWFCGIEKHLYDTAENINVYSSPFFI